MIEVICGAAAAVVAIPVATFLIVHLCRSRKRKVFGIDGAESDVQEAVIRRCWESGKTVIGHLRDDGTLEIEEFD